MVCDEQIRVRRDRLVDGGADGVHGEHDPLDLGARIARHETRSIPWLSALDWPQPIDRRQDLGENGWHPFSLSPRAHSIAAIRTRRVYLLVRPGVKTLLQGRDAAHAGMAPTICAGHEQPGGNMGEIEIRRVDADGSRAFVLEHPFDLSMLDVTVAERRYDALEAAESAADALAAALGCGED